MNGNNVMEGDANNRSNVCTSCTNDDNENKYGHVLMSIGYYCMQQYSQIRDEIGGSERHTPMVCKGPASRFIVRASVRMCHASNAHLWR